MGGVGWNMNVGDFALARLAVAGSSRPDGSVGKSLPASSERRRATISALPPFSRLMICRYRGVEP
jgi:alpha-D-ribose 1-methylphosphonate 5-triphosphate synthase subunit PhnG